MYGRLLRHSVDLAVASKRLLRGEIGDSLSDYIKTIGDLGIENEKMEAYLMEVTQNVLYDCFFKFAVGDLSSGQNKLDRLIKATSLYAQRSCKTYIFYYANFMRAVGFYMAKNWVEAIKCINPLISKCPQFSSNDISVRVLYTAATGYR